MKATMTARRRNIILTVLIISVLTIAAIVTTTLVTLNNRTPSTSGKPDPNPPPASQTMGLPLSDYRVDKEFAIDQLLYNTTLKLWQTHSGIDFAAERSAEVKAVLDGKVTKVGSTTLDGYYVVIEHSDGRVSSYKSLGKDTRVKEGDTVTKGQVIGTVSDTMLSETKQGAHLHFELTINGKSVNPADYIAELGGK